MSSKSNDQGRAYEYACLRNLEEQISKIRPCTVINNSSLLAAERAWNTLSDETKRIYMISSLAAVDKIFDMEPRITEQSEDILELLIQSDTNGETGDVRDILIIRNAITWEIGLSLKHNHFAVKHSRLSSKLDFGKSWYSIPCSQDYWDAVRPVFDYLAKEKSLGKKFSDLPHKEEDVYIPLLNAFKNELSYQSKLHKNVAARMVEYLLGKFDFYKVISVDKE
ncbi:MAG: HaeIII family restriction endonuclease, partial [Muribaculaceae bacterium]|nr:HaeIII family restriction endonuclease [Muribaculaceae bacterium]